MKTKREYLLAMSVLANNLYKTDAFTEAHRRMFLNNITDEELGSYMFRHDFVVLTERLLKMREIDVKWNGFNTIFNPENVAISFDVPMLTTKFGFMFDWSQKSEIFSVFGDDKMIIHVTTKDDEVSTVSKIQQYPELAEALRSVFLEPNVVQCGNLKDHLSERHYGFIEAVVAWSINS
jgi:hypothetical protein